MLGIKKKNETGFYKMFIDYADKIVYAGEHFLDLVKNYDQESKGKIADFKVIETECDMEAHKILSALNTASTTPFDREDMYDITKEMDNIVDTMEEVASNFKTFHIKEMRPEAIEMAEQIMLAINETKVMFNHLENLKKEKIVKEQIIEINRIENEGDIVFRKGMERLFEEEKDPIEVIKWKHIFEQLEESIDSCENVANLLEGVTIKYA